jgi:hypothetical protein
MHAISIIRRTALAIALAAIAPAATAAAIIDNGTVQLGINDTGNLNVPGGVPSLSGTTDVGLRYLPTGAESTAPGCLCEGWGVGDRNSGVAGYANVAAGGVRNLEVLSFSAGADRAESIVQVRNDAGAPVMKVTHSYEPSPRTTNLYVVKVRIENIGTTVIAPSYRRVMDWDIEPTPFLEYSTVVTGSATNLVFTSNNGFATANPLAGPSDIGQTGSFTDAGPSDHGALFDFQFADLAPGAAQEFFTYYGAAGNEASALAALAAVQAEAYSFGQATTDAAGMRSEVADARPDIGAPNTFIFAFGGIGGAPLFVPSTLTVSPEESRQRINNEACLTAMVLDQDGQPFAGAPVAFARSGANPGDAVVVSNAEGTAQHCWTGSNVGLDSVVASVNALSDDARVDWFDRALTRLDAQPAVLRLALLSGGTRIFLAPEAKLVLDASGAPVVGQTVIFEGANQRICEARTNLFGVARCSGYLRNVGSLLNVLRTLGYAARFEGNDDLFGSADTAKLISR